ncbi:MAG: AAA family ATPase, partial [Mangrovimonas sp.]|nr:AAA family ATPase [Mangrovimonas sp.]
MLTSLSIKNYALIDNLQVDFNSGLTIITGETGAGKSILLGALSLVLGKRADLSSVKNTSEKCVVEAVFDIASHNLKSVFQENDLDYEPQTIIRREILPSGKSRAFVNDTPV